MVSRCRHSAEFKTKVTLEVVKGQRLANEIASKFGVHRTMLSDWKKQAVEGLPAIFSNPAAREDREVESEKARLYQQIGQLQVELDWLKNDLVTVEERRMFIDPRHPQLSTCERHSTAVVAWLIC